MRRKSWWVGWLLLWVAQGDDFPAPFSAPAVNSPLYRSRGTPERDRKQARQYLDRGELSLKAGDLGGADEWAKKAQDLDPDLLAAYLLRGQILAGRGRLYEAENEYTVALLKNPESRPALEALIEVFLAQGKWKQAWRAISGYSEHLGPYGTALFKGLWHYKRGDYDRAAAELDRAQWFVFWGQTPLRYVDAVVLRAQVDGAAGRYDEALRRLAPLKPTGSNKTIPPTYLRATAPPGILDQWARSWQLEAIGRKALTQIEGRLDARGEAQILGELFSWSLSNKDRSDLAPRGQALTALVKGNLALKKRSGMKEALEELGKLGDGETDQYLTAAALAEALGDTPMAYRALWEGLRLKPSDTELLQAEVSLSLRSGEDLMAQLSAARLRRLSELLERPMSPRLKTLMAAADFRLGHYIAAAQWLSEKDLSKQPDLVRLRDLQFAFQGLPGAPWGDRMGYLTAIEESDLALVTVGKSRLFREAGDYERAAQTLLSLWGQAWEGSWPPGFFIQEALRAAMGDGKAKGPTVQLLSETIDKRCLGAARALQAARVLSGEVPLVESLSLKADGASLEAAARFAVLTGSGESEAQPRAALEAQVARDGNPRALSRLWWQRWQNLWKALEARDLGAFDRDFAAFEKEVRGRQSNRMDLVYLKLGADALRESQAMEASLKRSPGQSPDFGPFLKKYGRFPFAQNLVIQYHMDRDQLGEVDRLLSEALSAFPDRGGLHLLEGELHRRRGNPAGALEAFHLARVLDPNLAQAYRLEALVLSAQGRHAEAARLLTSAEGKFGPTREIQFSRARAAFDRGDYGGALNRYRAIAAVEPGQVETWNGAGQSAMALGRFDEAVFFFQRALDLGPDGQAARYHLARAHGMLGHLEVARDLLTTHLAQQGDEPWTQLALGQVLEASLKKAPPADFALLRRQARAAYGAAMANCPYYLEPHRTARSRLAVIMEPTLERKWVDLGAPVRGEAKITGKRGDILVAALENGKVLAYDLVAFKELWSFTLEEPAAMPPTPAGDLVALVGGSGRIHFVDVLGKARATFRTKSPLVAPPIWMEPFFLFPTENGTIEIFAEGRILDPVHLPADIAGSPALDGSTIWVGLQTGLVLAVDLFTGKVIHRVALGVAPLGPIRIHDRSVYVGLVDGRFCSLDTKTAKIDFFYKHDSAPGVFQAPLQYQTLYGTLDGQARLIDALGRFYWDFRADGSFTAAPSINPELAVFPLATGGMTAVGVSDGKIRFTVRLPGEPACAPVFVDNQLLAVLTREGRLSQFYYADESKFVTGVPHE